MERTVKLFIIPRDKVPGGPPNPARELTVEAPTLDGLRAAARSQVEKDGLRVRSISFGSIGLVVYAEEMQ
jgi:hypothetical protein